VRIFARHGTENAKGRSHRVTAALNCQLDDIFTVEIVWIFREARAPRVLDALIDRKNRHVACAGKPAVAKQALQIGQHANIAVGNCPDAIDEVRARQVQALLWNLGRFEAQQRFGFRAEIAIDFATCNGCGCHCVSPCAIREFL
jgi:hypothetical protein